MIALLPHTAFLSETSRLLAIHRALRARGAEVRVATHGGPHEALLRAAGVPCDRLDPPMSDERCARFLREIPGISSHRGSPYDADELRASVRAEAAWLRDRGARVVVTGFTLSTLLSARVAGIPLVTEHAGSFVPPVFEQGLVPAPRRSPIPLARFLPRSLQRWLANQGPTRVASYCAQFNTVAAELGVEPVPSLAALLIGDLTLVTELPEITGVPRHAMESWRPARPAAFRRDPVMRYVGPLLAPVDVPLPDEVSRFLVGPRPIVYVAITSTGPELVRRVVQELRGTGARVLVAGTVHALGDIADDKTCVAGVLPSHRVFPRVDAAVIAGGQGSVQTALAAGVPFVGLPLQPEQDWNVAAVERLGAAVRLAPDEIGAGALSGAVRQLLEQPAPRAAAQRVRDLYAGIDGAGRCAEEILRLVSRPARSGAGQAVTASTRG